MQRSELGEREAAEFQSLNGIKTVSFLLFPILVQTLQVFPLCLQLLLGGGCFSHTVFPSLPSVRQQKPLSALCGFSVPQFTSPCCVPAEFRGSSYADCCVNPQINFLGVQNGSVLR